MSEPMDAEKDALYGLGTAQALRLALLRIAADISPRPTGGAKAEDVVERARVLELYVAGPSSGSVVQAASEPPAPETGPPVKGPDAGPADLPTDGPKSAGSAAQASSA